MSRSDRLFRLLQMLRMLPAPVTAGRLARESGVSLRTVYRDIDTLRAAGARIEGEAGYGYTLEEDPALPPQSFTRLEIEAVALGLKEITQSGDEELAEAARQAMAKLVARLPQRQQREAMHAALYIYRQERRSVPAKAARVLREACWDETAVDLVYVDEAGRRTERCVLPLVVEYLDRVLVLIAWCRLRSAFRQFRLDRIEEVTPTQESFRPRRVGLIREYVAMMRSGSWP
jgi:predicted DNA-binding transcriptional regulator YafY